MVKLIGLSPQLTKISPTEILCLRFGLINIIPSISTISSKFCKIIPTDTKYYDEANVKKQFSAFVQTADRFDRSLLDRFIVQIYNSEMLDYIMPIYPWKSVIYTLYQAPSWTPESIIDFSKKSGVRFITYWGSALKPELVKKWKDSGIYTAAHTINNLPYANQLRESGVNIIYTDFLIP